MPYLLFVPDPDVMANDLASFGLNLVRKDLRSARLTPARGPGGKWGTIVSWTDVSRVMLANATWQRCAEDTASFWVSRGVKPRDAARLPVLPGSWVRLRDGQRWLIAPGQVTADLEYREQCRRMTKVVEIALLTSEPDTTDDAHDGAVFACLALQQNYRVTPAIIDTLELLDDQSVFLIIAAATGLEISHRKEQ